VYTDEEFIQWYPVAVVIQMYIVTDVIQWYRSSAVLQEKYRGTDVAHRCRSSTGVHGFRSNKVYWCTGVLPAFRSNTGVQM